MSSQSSPYAGARIALATMHGKAEALAPAFAALGATLVVAEGIDTDALGTFSGEVPRLQPPLETAIAKARLAMAATGLPLGLATEGSFGPDPVVGLVPLHREIAVLVDDLRGIVVSEQLNTHDTNYAGRWLRAGDLPTKDILDDTLLRRWGFPEHALIVRSEPFETASLAHEHPRTHAHSHTYTHADAREGADEGARMRPQVRKGLRDRAALAAAIDDCLAASVEGRVRVETDMRAHLNPTRMRNIALLGERLVERLRMPCSRCGAPGFGRVDVVTGLPCADCGAPTAGILAEMHACGACGHREQRARSDGRTHADPAHCDRCNP